MKAVIAHRDGEARVVQLSEPPLGRRTVLVRVSHAAMMLPQELEAIPTAASRVKPGEDGLPLGMMVSGLIDALGPDVRGFKEGLRVAAFGSPYVYHASKLSVPQNMVVELPKKVNHEEGAFAGQGAIAMNLFRSARVGLGEVLVVFGAGMTGLMTAQIARSAGARVLLVDEAEHRLSKGRNVGLTHTVGLERDAFVREVDKLSDGAGADAAILTPDAGDRAGRFAALALRWQGRLVTFGEQHRSLTADLLADKELRLVPVTGAGPGHGDPDFESGAVEYPRANVRWTVRDNMRVFLDLLADRRVQISPLISERTPLERAPHAYEKIGRAPSTVIGAILTL